MTAQMLPLLGKNLLRNRRRSLLTVAGVAVAVFVITALSAAVAGMTFPVREVGADRLLKSRERSRANVLASRLPQGYENQVAELPGVAGATGVLSGLALLGEEGVHVFVHGVDPERYREVRDLVIAEEDWEAFRADRQAALIGHRLLQRLGWEVGDRVEIEALSLSVQIVGRIPQQGVDLESHLLVRRDGLQAALGAAGQVSYLLIEPDPDGPPGRELAAAVDEFMAVAPVKTTTVTAAAFAEAVIEDFMGFIDYLVLMKWITVVITVLGAANAIAMSVRERTQEIGALRALGFTPGLVSRLVVLESTTMALVGGLVGLGLAAWALDSSAGELAGLELAPSDVLQALLASALVGVVGGAGPARAAARLRPVEALRVID